MVVNEAMSDTEVEAIIDAFSAADEDRRALLDETHGILWHVEDMAWEILEQSIDDQFVGSLVLSEAGRIGSRSIQDA